MEVGQNKALKGKIRGEEDGTFDKRVSTHKGFCQHIQHDQNTRLFTHRLLYFKSGDKRSMLKWKMSRISVCQKSQHP